MARIALVGATRIAAIVKGGIQEFVGVKDGVVLVSKMESYRVGNEKAMVFLCLAPNNNYSQSQLS